MKIISYIVLFIISCFSVKGMFTFYRGLVCQFNKDEKDREKSCNGYDCFSCENCPYYIEK